MSKVFQIEEDFNAIMAQNPSTREDVLRACVAHQKGRDLFTRSRLFDSFESTRGNTNEEVGRWEGTFKTVEVLREGQSITEDEVILEVNKK